MYSVRRIDPAGNFADQRRDWSNQPVVFLWPPDAATINAISPATLISAPQRNQCSISGVLPPVRCQNQALLKISIDGAPKRPAQRKERPSLNRDSHDAFLAHCHILSTSLENIE